MMIFECEVSGNAIATVWSGTAIMCPATNNEIVLLHSRFNNTTSCSNGNNIITGEIIEANGNNYVSQLNITVIPFLIGKTVKCSRDDGEQSFVVMKYIIMNDTGNNANIYMAH